MKEPPMNGLSVEARQMVASALNLVMKDIEQLRQVNLKHLLLPRRSAYLLLNSVCSLLRRI